MFGDKRVNERVEGAAKNSGYYPDEARAVADAPELALAHNHETNNLRRVPQAVESFINIMQGKGIDHKALVSFTHQLRDIAEKPYDIEKYEAWKRHVEDNRRIGLSPWTPEPRYDLTFEDEQQLLLMKNLLEDAFFAGDLTEIHGESAGAIAFFCNRLAKIIERIWLEAQEHFAFETKPFNTLLQKTDAYYAEHFGIEAKTRTLQDHLDDIKRRSLADEEDPRVIRMDLLKKETERPLPEISSFATGFRDELMNAETERLVAEFETLVPIGIANRNIVRGLLGKCLKNLSLETGARYALQRLVQKDVCIAFAITTSARYGLDSAELVAENERVAKLLLSFTKALGNVPEPKRSALKPLAIFTAKLATKPSGDIGELCAATRSRSESETELHTLEWQIVNRPLNRKLIEEITETRRALAELDISDPALRHSAYEKSRGSFCAHIAAHPYDAVFWLYFMKDYMVAVDQSTQPDFKPASLFSAADKPSIDTYAFANTFPQGIWSDVHYRADFLPLAHAIVQMQRAEREKRKQDAQ